MFIRGFFYYVVVIKLMKVWIYFVNVYVYKLYWFFLGLFFIVLFLLF